MKEYYYVGNASDDGCAIKVRSTDNLYNYVNREGNLISKEWFIECNHFINGIAAVHRKYNECNYLKENGEYLLDKWYAYCGEFDKEGFGVISERLIINGEHIINHYIVNTNGEILNKIPFLYIRGFQNGFSVVTGFNRKYNIINSKGEIVLPNWYQNIYIYDNGLASVQDQNKINFIDLKQDNFSFVSNQWYDWCGYSFNFNRMCVGIEGKDGYMFNYINEYGEIISPNMWFNNCDKHFIKEDYQKYPLVEVKLFNKCTIKCNLMDINGNIVCKEWLEHRIF